MSTQNTTEQLDIEKIRAEISHLMATTSKLNAETDKIRRERFFYPIVIAISFAGALAAFLKILNVFGG